MYGELQLYPDDFGAPAILTETEMSIKEMDKVKYESFKSRNDVEKSGIKYRVGPGSRETRPVSFCL